MASLLVKYITSPAYGHNILWPYRMIDEPDK
jgi:hypothetical protein